MAQIRNRNGCGRSTQPHANTQCFAHAHAHSDPHAKPNTKPHANNPANSHTIAFVIAHSYTRTDYDANSKSRGDTANSFSDAESNAANRSDLSPLGKYASSLGSHASAGARPI